MVWQLATYVSDSNLFDQIEQCAVSQWCLDKLPLRLNYCPLRVFYPSACTLNTCHPAISGLQLVLRTPTFSTVNLNAWASDVARPKCVFSHVGRNCHLTRTWDACVGGLGLRSLALLSSSSGQHSQVSTWLCGSMGLALLVLWILEQWLCNFLLFPAEKFDMLPSVPSLIGSGTGWHRETGCLSWVTASWNLWVCSPGSCFYCLLEIFIFPFTCRLTESMGCVWGWGSSSSTTPLFNTLGYNQLFPL